MLTGINFPRELHSLFHRIDFLILKILKVACTFSCGQATVVLEAKTNKEVNLSVGHIYDVLDRFFGRIVVSQEGQLIGEFGINGLINESEKRLRRRQGRTAQSVSHTPPACISVDFDRV